MCVSTKSTLTPRAPASSVRRSASLGTPRPASEEGLGFVITIHLLRLGAAAGYEVPRLPRDTRTFEDPEAFELPYRVAGPLALLASAPGGEEALGDRDVLTGL